MTSHPTPPTDEVSSPPPVSKGRKPKPPEFLRLAAAAQVIGIEPAVLTFLERRGVVASVRTPRNPQGHRLYRRSDLLTLRRQVEADFEKGLR